MKKTAAPALVPGLSFGYVYDGMGNRITSTAGTAPNVAETSYARDALNQYTSITTPGKADILVRSDNPVTMTVAGTAVTPTSTGNLYNAHATISNNPGGSYYEVVVTDGNSPQSGHRWLRPSTVAPETPYDDDGNLTQDGRWSYHWDAENRLIKLQTLTSAIAAGAPALTLEYAYDWRGRRIGAKTTLGANITSDIRTLYDQWNPVATFYPQDSTLAIRHTLLWGPDLSGSHQGAGGVGGLICITDVSNSQTYLPSYDTNGNIIAWSDLTGQLIRRLDYDPFGNVILKETFAGDSSDLDKILTHGFSTKPADPDSGLIYYGYRWYDPMTGRWPSRDPIEEQGGLNLCGFIGNDAINRLENLGLFPYFGPGGNPAGGNPGFPYIYPSGGIIYPSGGIPNPPPGSGRISISVQVQELNLKLAPTSINFIAAKASELNVCGGSPGDTFDLVKQNVATFAVDMPHLIGDLTSEVSGKYTISKKISGGCTWKFSGILDPETRQVFDFGSNKNHNLSTNEELKVLGWLLNWNVGNFAFEIEDGTVQLNDAGSCNN